MKYLLLIIVSFVVIMVSMFGLQYVASERVEVIELQTQDEQNKTLITRLWIVDYEGNPYLRSGDDQSGWYARLRNAESIVVTRNGQDKTYRTVIKPELKDIINELMKDKYTWGDAFISAIFTRDKAIPIQLIEIPAET